MDAFFYPILIAGLVAGGGAGLLGVYLVGMRLPFIGTCISHAAMAGAIFASLLHFNIAAGSVIASVIAAVVLASIRPDKLRLETNVAMAIVFSLMLGLTFLGIGMIQGSRTETLSLLWGNLLFVTTKTVVVISILTMVLGAFVFLFNRELKTILFSRTIAAATGVPERLVYMLFLVLCAVIVAVNLPAVGGLLIFSLLTNPAAAAYQLCRGFCAVVWVSVIFGIASALTGFIISYYANLPTGACIVIVSTLIFAISAAYRSWSIFTE